MRRIIVIALVLVLLVSAGRHLGNAPVNARATQSVFIEISPGLSARAVANKLADAGVLRSATGFVMMTTLRGARDKLQAGTYEVSPRDSGSTILRRLMSGDTTPTDLSVTFPEGFTLKQIAERLDAQGIVKKDAFLTAATAERFRAEFPFLAGAPQGASLEGYLFPDTYRFYRDSDPRAVLQRILQRFGEQLDAAQKETGAIPGGGHPAASAHALVTMASIVEREVQSEDDMRVVAGILWDRLRVGMGLDADATVRYALDNWEEPLTVKDLAVDSPYNTRKYRGLPPGPIGNPGLQSLKAALKPESSKFVYYLSAPDGRTIFSVTLDEHNRAKATYLGR